MIFRVLLLGLCLAGCKKPSAPAHAREVKDTIGRVVHLPAKVERIITLAPSSTEILYALGAGPQIVGVDRFSDFPAEVKKVEKVGANIDPSLERIVALRPDCVFVATSANSQTTVIALERLNVPVFVSRSASLADVEADMIGIAEVLGRREAGVKLAAELKRRIDAVRARVAGRPPVSTLVVVWPEPLTVAGGKTHVNELVRAAGGRNVADDSDQPFPTYSVERVLARAPEVLIVGSHADGTPPTAPLERLTSVPAVRHKRIHIVDGNELFRPGPRLGDATETLAALFHPGAGADGGAP